MGLVEKKSMASRLCPPLDNSLTIRLLDEFVSIERRFIQCDWEPAELDGGQFCEVLAWHLYHQDSGTLNTSKSVNECLKYVEDDAQNHAIQPRHDALHLGRVIRTVYKFRSQRGAVHISPTYQPNHMDAKLLIECVRWCMNETLRVFGQGDREVIAVMIRELLQFDVPCIGSFQGALLVQRTDLTPDEEILVLLHYAGEAGFSRLELGKYAMCSASSVTRALQALTSPKMRQAVALAEGSYRLTDLGAKRIREELSEKLLLV
jgi:hypothetical protein